MKKQSNKKVLVHISFIIIFTLLGIRIYIDNETIGITKSEVYSDEIPDAFNNYKILQLSDLHSKEFGENNANLILKINEADPDIIVMTGDMVNAKDTDYTIFYNLVESIFQSYKMFFITGNHEQDIPNEKRKELFDYLEKHDVIVLNNEMVQLTKGNDIINLYGLWYNSKYYFSDGTNESILKEEIISKLIGEADKSEYNILLTHNPKHFEEYSKWGADLVFSGHVHGGMVRLPVVGALFSPERTFFPEYSEGIYEYENAKMVVSRGAGIGTKGFRLFNKPEINLITLVAD